jgi:hypothetical protein
MIEEEELIKEEALEAEHQLEVEFNTLEQHESKNFNEEVLRDPVVLDTLKVSAISFVYCEFNKIIHNEGLVWNVMMVGICFRSPAFLTNAQS